MLGVWHDLFGVFGIWNDVFGDIWDGEFGGWTSRVLPEKKIMAWKWKKSCRRIAARMATHITNGF